MKISTLITANLSIKLIWLPNFTLKKENLFGRGTGHQSRSGCQFSSQGTVGQGSLDVVVDETGDAHQATGCVFAVDGLSGYILGYHMEEKFGTWGDDGFLVSAAVMNKVDGLKRE